MLIKIDPKEKLSFTLYFLIKKYTQYESILNECAPPLDVKFIYFIFENTPVTNFISKILTFKDSDFWGNLNTYLNEKSFLRNFYFSLLYKDKKLNKFIRGKDD